MARNISNLDIFFQGNNNLRQMQANQKPLN